MGENVILTRKNYTYYEKQKENEKNDKREKMIHPVFESILNSFTAIYGLNCKNG